MGKEILRELGKRLKFDQTNKWRKHKIKICPWEWDAKNIWNFEIQMDYLIPTRKPDLQEKKNLPSTAFCRSSRPQNED